MQTVSTNLEYAMLKAGYDEDLAREWVPVPYLYWMGVIGLKYYMALHAHLWKVATTYSWDHVKLQLEQHVKELRQIRQTYVTHLHVVSFTYIYL
jgi:hypothetical protein